MSSYVVLGASRGIGVKQERDNKVFAVVRTPESAAQLHSLASTRSNVFTVKGDLDSADSLKASMTAAAATEVAGHTSGKLDVLILNGARITSQYSGMTLDKFPDPQSLEEDLMAGFRCNTVGVAHAINAFLPLLRAGAKKHILAISTAAGDIDFVREIGMGANVAYAASKAALNMVATQFSIALKPEGFTVLSISPGYVNTFTEDPSCPDFDGNPRTPAVAVSMMLDVLNRSGPGQSGSFVSQYGNKEWV
ncbi:NAD(P)-binding protein [Epithele typhae]|uniref:NAD(P)-binding protein n=1 Tax=Epithele typhae TaxID=378194 RepID=UPI00200853EA|nr:NAD(P)-binding protein [Epithele typhae]KAH9935949.1 NAD(P)-binding protein [Epithele typhae]